ncbi:MAG: DUF2905 domain-containing protein [Anaerolineae bacterium]|nr:DUF2905 domain-containing protein [Anaerolineae bacterium]
MQAVGKVLLIVGIGLALVGGFLMLLARLPFFSQLGNLPGDIRVEGQGFSCIVPIVSMILLSIVLTILVNVIVRLINRP